MPHYTTSLHYTECLIWLAWWMLRLIYHFMELARHTFFLVCLPSSPVVLIQDLNSLPMQVAYQLSNAFFCCCYPFVVNSSKLYCNVFFNQKGELFSFQPNTLKRFTITKVTDMQEDSETECAWSYCTQWYLKRNVLEAAQWSIYFSLKCNFFVSALHPSTVQLLYTIVRQTLLFLSSFLPFYTVPLWHCGNNREQCNLLKCWQDVFSAVFGLTRAQLNIGIWYSF